MPSVNSGLDPDTLLWAAENFSHVDSAIIMGKSLPGEFVTEIIDSYPRTVAMMLRGWAAEVSHARDVLIGERVNGRLKSEVFETDSLIGN